MRANAWKNSGETKEVFLLLNRPADHEQALEPQYTPENPTYVKPSPDLDNPSYSPVEVSTYKPDQVDFNKPESLGNFPDFPMPDFSQFFDAGFMPDFNFDVPKIGVKNEGKQKVPDQYGPSDESLYQDAPKTPVKTRSSP